MHTALHSRLLLGNNLPGQPVTPSVKLRLSVVQELDLSFSVQLETKLKEKIDSSLVEKVDFSQEQERFHRCVCVCVYVWVCSLFHSCMHCLGDDC